VTFANTHTYGSFRCVAIGEEILDVIKISIPNIFVNYVVKLRFITVSLFIWSYSHYSKWFV